MKRYIETETQIRNMIMRVFNESEKGKHIDHRLWDRLMWHMRLTNEIVSLDLYASDDPERAMNARPRFIEGFSDRFFDSNDWAYGDRNKIDTILFNHRPHWTYDDLKQLYSFPISIEAIDTLYELAAVILARGSKWTLVSGPISTGGLLSREKNLAAFHDAIVLEAADGHLVFNQMPLEDFFGQIHDQHGYAFTVSSNPIMDRFYEKVLRSGHIARLKMKSGWQTSVGAQKEYGLAKELGITIVTEETLAPA